MVNENQKNPEDQYVTSTEYDNTPKEVIANTARFNKQFLDKQLGGKSYNGKYRKNVNCNE